MSLITTGVHLSNENPTGTIWARGNQGHVFEGSPQNDPSVNMNFLRNFANVKISRSSEVIEFKDLNASALNNVLSFLFGNRKKTTPKNQSMKRLG